MVGSSKSDHSILFLHVFLSLEPPCTHRTSKPLSPTVQLNYQGTCATWKPAARGSRCEHTGLIENKAISLPGEAAETRWLKPGMMVPCLESQYWAGHRQEDHILHIRG